MIVFGVCIKAIAQGVSVQSSVAAQGECSIELRADKDSSWAIFNLN
jgi:hypothetical protein